MFIEPAAQSKDTFSQKISLPRPQPREEAHGATTTPSPEGESQEAGLYQGKGSLLDQEV